MLSISALNGNGLGVLFSEVKVEIRLLPEEFHKVRRTFLQSAQTTFSRDAAGVLLSKDARDCGALIRKDAEEFAFLSRLERILAPEEAKDKEDDTKPLFLSHDAGVVDFPWIKSATGEVAETE